MFRQRVSDSVVFVGVTAAMSVHRLEPRGAVLFSDYRWWANLHARRRAARERWLRYTLSVPIGWVWSVRLMHDWGVSSVSIMKKSISDVVSISDWPHGFE